MAVDDLWESEVVLAAAATATLLAPPVRALVRRGAIAGLAGVLTAADLLRSTVQVVASGVDLTRERASRGLEDIIERPPEAGTPPAQPADKGGDASGIWP